MALFVKHAGEYGKHAAAKKAGFQKNDVIVELDGSSGRATESEVIGRLLHKHSPGEKVKAAVLRGEQRIDLVLPIQ
jgi:S1-C subfamily serine protease